MEVQEFKFVYQDMKTQLKQIPSLPLLLKSIQKTTKKLQCLNLYSHIDKKQFDLQLYQNKIFEQISQMLQQVASMHLLHRDNALDMQQVTSFSNKIQAVKQQKMDAFDHLDRLQQKIQDELQGLVNQAQYEKQYKIENQIKQVDQQIREVQEDEQENAEEHSDPHISAEKRVDALRREIQELNKKISRTNKGKGQWFDGDHRDFIQIYNRCGGQTKKIVSEGERVLGMKATEIMDHLQLYENYLQMQKEKKLASEQFKGIRFLQKQLNSQQQVRAQLMLQQQQQAINKVKDQQNQEKKKQVLQFRKKQKEEQQKLVSQAEKDRVAQKKKSAVSMQKRKEIEDRNKRLIQQKQEAFKMRQTSNQPKPRSKQVNINIPNQVYTLKQVRIPKPSRS